MTAIALLAIALTFQSPPPTPPRDTPAVADAAGPGVITGRVADGTTKSPLKNVLITLFSPERGQQEPLSTTSDAEGRWEFRGLALGEYHVSCQKAGYVIADGRSVGLTNARQERTIDLALFRGGVLTGRVTDADGDPVADAQVMVFRPVPTGRGQMRWENHGGNGTDDRGDFRLYGLPPGEYILGAQPQDPTRRPQQKVTPVLTFFPGTPDPNQAQRITIDVASEFSDLVFALQSLPTVTIRGRVTPAPGQMGTSFVHLMRSDDDSMPDAGNARTSQIAADGTFEIPAVPSGTYRLNAIAARVSGEPRFGAVEVAVNDQDISGIVVATQGPTIVRGRVVLTPGGATLPGPIGIGASSISQTRFVGYGTEGAVAKPDGTFELNVFQPPVKLYAQVPANGWHQSSIRWKGNDISGGLIFEPGQIVEGVEITLRQTTSRVTGSVSGMERTGEDDEGTVIVFRNGPDDDQPAGAGIVALAPIREARFSAGPLPAGDYQVVAIRTPRRELFERPEVIEILRARAVEVSLGNGDNKSVTLTLVTDY